MGVGGGGGGGSNLLYVYPIHEVHKALYEYLLFFFFFFENFRHTMSFGGIFEVISPFWVTLPLRGCDRQAMCTMQCGRQPWPWIGWRSS